MSSDILASQVVREGGSQGGFELGVWDTEGKQVVRVVFAQCRLVPYSLTKASSFMHADARTHPNTHLCHILDVFISFISILGFEGKKFNHV